MHHLQQILASRTRGIMGQENAVKTAVLIPLLQQKNGWSILFEKRAKTLRRQAGEICFPGGHVEKTDPDEQYTALRETSEELGILANEIEIVGPLDIFVSLTGLMIYPYVGIIHSEKLEPNSAEVDELFTITLSELLAYHPSVYDILLAAVPPADFPYHLIPQGKNYPFRQEHRQQWFFELDGRIIWGLTARILVHFLEIFRKAGE